MQHGFYVAHSGICILLFRYPVTLSLENHCSIEQQDVMAQHMTEILGGWFVVHNLWGCSFK